MSESHEEPERTPVEKELEDSWRPEDKAAKAAHENPREFQGGTAVESTGEE